MYKKTITFENFDGVTVTKDYYFNLTNAELTRLQLKITNGGRSIDDYSAAIDRANNDTAAFLANIGKDYSDIYNIFEEVVKASYGVRTPDGVDFDKSELLSNRFMASEAYSVLLTELLNDPAKASEFMIGIAPSDKKESMRNLMANKINAKQA